jgi:hypothetical protein
MIKYSAAFRQILSKRDHAALAAADRALRVEAEAEMVRLSSPRFGCQISQRCYASGQALKFLKVALAAPLNNAPAALSSPSSPIIETTPAPPLVIEAVSPPTEDDEAMTSRLKGLADAAKAAVTDLNAQADTAVTRLNTAKTKAQDGLAKINSIAADIEQSTQEIEDFANQTSNFPPTGEK